MRAVLVQNMQEKYAEFGEICAKVCSVYMLHICGITEICGVNDVRVSLRWTKCAEMLKKCDRICGNMRIYANFYKFMHK